MLRQLCIDTPHFALIAIARLQSEAVHFPLSKALSIVENHCLLICRDKRVYIVLISHKHANLTCVDFFCSTKALEY